MRETIAKIKKKKERKKENQNLTAGPLRRFKKKKLRNH